MFAVKVFDISDSKIKIAGDVLYNSGAELEFNQPDDYKNTLSISIPNKDMAAIVLSVDVNNQGFRLYSFAGCFETVRCFEIFYPGSSVGLNSDEASVKEIPKFYLPRKIAS